MKKSLFCVLFLLILLFSGCITKEKETKNQELSKNVKMSVNVGEGKEDVKYLVEGDLTAEYEIHGVESFAVSFEGIVYLLNGASNSVKVYEEGSFKGEITYEAENAPMDIEISDDGKKIYLLLDTGEYMELDTTLKRGKNEWNKRAYEKDEDTLVTGFIKRNGNLVIKEAGEENKSISKRGYVNKNDYRNIDENIKGLKTIIGYDKEGNRYILSTILLYNNTGNMDIEQAIYKTDEMGKVKGAAKVYDNIDYVTPKKNIYVSQNGKIYQLCTYQNKVEILELELKESIEFEYHKKQRQLNKMEKEISILSEEEAKKATTGAKLTREEMYNRAIAITDVIWTFNSTNNRSRSSSVTLPKHLRSISGSKTVTGLPYCWGGWDSKDGFLNNISNSKSAGNVYCSGGYKSGTAGTDCSGFVSRVWGMSSKLGTSMIIDNGWITKIAYDKLQKMDILVMRGHVVFYISGDAGGITTLESTTGGTEQRAKKYYRTWTYLRNDGYIAGKYKNTVESTPIVPGKIDYTIPSIVNINSKVTFNGTYTGVVSAKRQITGFGIVDLGKVSGGTFKFDVTFGSNTGTREMTVWGYDSLGREVAKVVKKFNVTDPNAKNYTLIISHSANVVLGAEVLFSGNANDISKVEVKVDGWTITPAEKVSVSNGKYAFKYKFNGAGLNRKVEAIGYDETGKAVKTATSVINVTAPIVNKIDYTVPTFIKAGSTVRFKGTYSGNVVSVKRQIKGFGIVDLGKVSGGNFEFNVTFGNTTGIREMTVWGYDNAGKEIVKIVKTFNVNSYIDYTIPSTITKGSTVTFNGVFGGDIVKVKRQITGSTLVDLGNVSGGTFKFDVIFGNTTGTREMTVWGYDNTGKETAKIVKTFNVK